MSDWAYERVKYNCTDITAVDCNVLIDKRAVKSLCFDTVRFHDSGCAYYCAYCGVTKYRTARTVHTALLVDANGG